MGLEFKRKVQLKHIKFRVISIIWGLANWDPWDKSSCCLSFVIKFDWTVAMLVHLHAVCGCFCTATGVATETTWPRKPTKFTIWPCTESLPPPGRVIFKDTEVCKVPKEWENREGKKRQRIECWSISTLKGQEDRRECQRGLEGVASGIGGKESVESWSDWQC